MAKLLVFVVAWHFLPSHCHDTETPSCTGVITLPWWLLPAIHTAAEATTLSSMETKNITSLEKYMMLLPLKPVLAFT